MVSQLREDVDGDCCLRGELVGHVENVRVLGTPVSMETFVETIPPVLSSRFWVHQ